MSVDPTSVLEIETEPVEVGAREDADVDLVVEDELLIEDVSIDGMCGVY